jgi:hypothetical protein
VPPPVETLSRTGKFWRVLGPTSASPASLGVMPLMSTFSWSMPRFWFEWIELPRTGISCAEKRVLMKMLRVSSKKTPVLLKAMRLAAPGDVPPRVTSRVPWRVMP